MSGEVAIPEDVPERFEDSLEREHEAERDLLKAIVKSILVALPIMIGVFLLLAAIAFSDKVEWYVWIGFGVGIGVIGAVLLGALGGATLNAHKLDDVDRITAGLDPDAP
jgi:hypothetical protein